MTHDVFISHAHKDKSIADAICAKLESAHLKCWTTAQGISAREDWTEATGKAIGSSHVIILVLSENATAAPHIKREIAQAFYMRRTIIPFRLAETLPQREILSYLGNVPWFNALNPPSEQQLEALTVRIKGLMPGCAGNATPPQSESKKTASLNHSNSWFGALKASHYKTLGILKWVAIATALFAVVWPLWFAFRRTKEGASLAESQLESMHGGPSVSPTSSLQAGRDASNSTPTSAFTRFGLWQAKSGATPLVQQGPLDPSLNTPAERFATETSSSQPNVTPGDQAEGLASEPRPRHLPPVTHRVAHDHHQQYPGTQVKEARKIAALENQRDELQTRLSESEEKTQIAQKNADTMARQLDELRDQLKETENRALTAQKDEELVRTQRDALQTRLQETEGEAQAARKNADLATRQLDELQSEMGELRERAQLAETKANLAASQRDAMETELKKKDTRGEKARLSRHGANLAQLPNSAPDTQFQESPKDAQPAHYAEFAQTQPPNPGQNAKPAPLTQTLESTGPSRN